MAVNMSPVKETVPDPESSMIYFIEPYTKISH